jgi:hypothetical protein
MSFPFILIGFWNNEKLGMTQSGTPCSFDIRFYWIVKMLIVLAAWAIITN